MAAGAGSTNEALPVVDFQVTTLGETAGPLVHVSAGTTMRELNEMVAAALQTDAAAQKLVLGGVDLDLGEEPVESVCADAWDAALADGTPVQLLLVMIGQRDVVEKSTGRVTFVENASPKVFNAPPGCPTAGEYDHTSIHHWSNHSGGGTVVRLPLPEAFVQIKQVRACAVAQDQGWGGTGSAGVCVVLLNGEGEELAYSLQSIDGHGEKRLEWVMTPEAHGGSFPAKAGEEAYSSVCGQGEGLVLELRAFTPNWGGWSVTALEGELAATIIG
eukprot:CAMPEP_0117539372 /NCGR_PEP_ID=MMETSP0784-20121206/42951_1 /TAXON_ID=39447 /ORGANISM="" /LENGTH=272 /DNA_ID=CAMNT_0005335997 /DNA_START=70 /DNA_END=888 /DNA_ORIENTATION=+